MLTNPLFLTILLEEIVLLLLYRREPLFHLYFAATNTLTNTLANLCVLWFIRNTQVRLWLVTAVVELLVLLFEFFLAYLYTKDAKTSAKLSAVCNATSFLLGTVLIFIFNLGGGSYVFS